MKILVTGGTGNVGSRVCKELSKKDIQVVAASRTNIEGLCNEKTKHIVFDFEAPSTFDNALEGVDLVVLIAPPLSTDSNQKIVPFIRYARNKGINNFVFLSIIDASAGDWLRDIEEELKSSNCVHSIVRSNILMDTFTNGFVSGMIENLKEISVPGGDGEISLISSSDVAKAISKICINLEKHNGNTYTITGGLSINFTNISETISIHRGEEIPFRDISPTELKQLAEDNGIPKEITNIFLILFGASTMGLLAKVTKDFKKITGVEAECFDNFYKRFVSKKISQL